MLLVWESEPEGDLMQKVTMKSEHQTLIFGHLLSYQSLVRRLTPLPYLFVLYKLGLSKKSPQIEGNVL